MCGISGFFQTKGEQSRIKEKLEKANEKLMKRGPDGGSCWTALSGGLAHRRLSIIDTSTNASQPMSDVSGRYTIAFNGEIFNFAELKDRFFPGKNDWHSHSDTEVLLYLYMQLKEKCLEHLEGFFAFAIYDKQEDELFLARDRFGKKPLLYYRNEDFFVFASEMKALMAYDIPRELNYTALLLYLQLNYIPQPSSILKGIHKLKPGHYILISKEKMVEEAYYSLHLNPRVTDLTYEQASGKLVQLMDESVRKRMISDVPLGAFLSGGIDSSVVVAMASRHTQQLNTFSIGYKDNPFFDETPYANLVAKKYNTKHTVFSLTNNDFLEHLDHILDYLDEPFADSSAIPVYILSYHTRRHVTVALSGDGGDEVFAGYNKHQAEWRMRQKNMVNSLVKAGGPIWNRLPKSRNSKMSNLVRQLDRFAEGGKLDVKERYWRWAGFQTSGDAAGLMTPAARSRIDMEAYQEQKDHILRHLRSTPALEDMLLTDMELVLLSDMLVKVDMMSMANSLEVRSPFLDHKVVDFAFSLPTAYKINSKLKKRIVQDAFRSYLPEELYNRPKKGFEIPLLDWFRKELKTRITDDWLNDKFIEEQGLFDANAIRNLKAKLFSNNPGDVHATIWALVVFQNWWRKYMA